MVGHLITDYIAVNCNTPVHNIEKCAHFLTHVNKNAKARAHIVHNSVKTLYTTSFNAWYMMHILGIKDIKYKVFDESDEIEVTGFKKTFRFIFLHANYTVGSVMILFKGEFGDQLYAPNGRFSHEMLHSKVLEPYIFPSSKGLAKLYMDASYFKCPFVIPSKRDVMHEIIATIKKHDNEIVNINCQTLGLEGALCFISKTLNKPIFVENRKMDILQALGYGQHFTTDITTTNIRTINSSQFQIKDLKNMKELLGPTILIIMSAHYYLNNWLDSDDLEKKGVYMFPYTTHNSAEDASLLVKSIDCKELILINSKKASQESPLTQTFIDFLKLYYKKKNPRVKLRKRQLSYRSYMIQRFGNDKKLWGSHVKELSEYIEWMKMIRSNKHLLENGNCEYVLCDRC